MEEVEAVIVGLASALALMAWAATVGWQRAATAERRVRVFEILAAAERRVRVARQVEDGARRAVAALAGLVGGRR